MSNLTSKHTFISLSKTKPIFRCQENPELFGKGGLSKREVAIQKIAARLGVAPAIHSIVKHNQMSVVLMQKIHGSSLADFYGSDPIPTHVWDQVKAILQLLWNNGIEYKDITPYNFMLEPDAGKVWIVDFGHARQVKINPFLREVLNGTNTEWSPDFT